MQIHASGKHEEGGQSNKTIKEYNHSTLQAFHERHGIYDCTYIQRGGDE